jgi:hypothetical protein
MAQKAESAVGYIIPEKLSVIVVDLEDPLARPQHQEELVCKLCLSVDVSRVPAEVDCDPRSVQLLEDVESGDPTPIEFCEDLLAGDEPEQEQEEDEEAAVARVAQPVPGTSSLLHVQRQSSRRFFRQRT